MKTNEKLIVLAMVAVFFIAAAVPMASGDILEENYAVEDAVAAFDALTDRGEWLGFRRSPDAPANNAPAGLSTSSYHFQGIARSCRAGIYPVLYATRAGCPDCLEPWKSEGTLLVVEMGSRDKDGERLRSNRLVRHQETQDTAPDARDKVVKVINFDENLLSEHDTAGRADYNHIGGLQMVGDILAVPLEGKNNPILPEGKVVFFNASDPLDPKLMDYELTFEDPDLSLFDHKAGVVAMTRLPSGHFFLAVCWGDSEELQFYRSNKTSFFDVSGAEDTEFVFEFHSTLNKSYLQLLEDLGMWRFGKTSPQALNFVNEKNEDGENLYLIGSSNSCSGAPWHFCGGAGKDDIWLWKVIAFNEGEQAQLLGVRRDSKLLYSDGNLLGDVTFARQEANFNASGSAYVSPTGELIYYSTEYYFWSTYGIHTHCGWSGSICGDPADNYLRFIELHHNEVSYTGACGLQLPSDLGGPFSINEGDTLALDFGIYYVKPWAHMYEDEDFVGKCHESLPATEAYHCSTVMMDYDDQDKEDYDDFKRLDGPSLPDNGFSDQLTSFRWCAPQGATLYLYDDDSFDPGGNTGYVECAGTGYVVTNSDFQDDVPAEGCYHSHDVEDFNDEATSAEIDWAKPEMYVITVDWGDGEPEETFITLPEEPFFNVAHLYLDDNPSGTPSDDLTITITDPLGSGIVTTTVTVNNVSPTVSIDSVTDETGTDIGGLCAPFALVGLEVNVAGSFSDSGAEDTHTAAIDWDDGTIDDIGAVVDTAQGSHSFSAPGEYTITLIVTDDDTGQGEDATQIIVVDAKSSIVSIIKMLKPLAGQPDVGRAIRQLGLALQNWEKASPNAILEKIQHSIRHLEAAEAANPNLDLTCIKSLLTLTAKSATVKAIAGTKAVVGRPNEKRKVKKAEDLVEKGDALLERGIYVGAVELYQKAMRTIQSIWMKDLQGK
ncbi:MAG: PKD domain-containing protein [Deferrisomatales bacterium]|nr:PKD domain-containing protein [Deferrisomatales bacterium]